MPTAIRNELLVAAAECDWKLNRLTKRELDAIPDTNDEAGARRLYLLMELARDGGDTATVQSIDSQMETRFPVQPLAAEALYSSGNMFLLLKDYPNAITYYGEVAKRFPTSRYAPSAHWRTGWLNYRLGHYAEAARLFDEQIRYYAGGKEIPSALYWRGRIYRGPGAPAVHRRRILQDHRAGLSALLLRHAGAGAARGSSARSRPIPSPRSTRCSPSPFRS